MPLKVLSALDTAKTQFYHFKAIIMAGMGLFTDAYDLFCIPPIMVLIGHVYYQDEVENPKDRYKVPIPVSSTMFAMALLGTVIGQLVFGRLGDRMGRRHVYGLALMLMILGSIGCGFSICTTRGCVLGSLGFFRFLLGIGIGGDYPLSATIMSEFANKRTRGAFIAAVFSMQGFGILVSSMVTMVVCATFDAASRHVSHEKHTPMAVDIAWRVILMIGAIPASMTFYWRMMMPETARYTALVERNVLQAAKNMEKVLQVSLSQIAEDSEFPPPQPPSYRLLSKEFFRRHGRDLFSCAISWFLVDIIFYSINLVGSQVNSSRYLHTTNGVNAYKEAYHVARLQAIIAVCSTIPGYFASVYYIDRIGRVKIQISGFLLMAFTFLAVGIPYSAYWHHHTNVGFLLLYGLTFFLANFGPNTTTFIVPAELFPARFRSTCHGISGAMGKVGAIVGAVGFLWVTHDQVDSKSHAMRMTAALVILGGVSFLGAIITYFFTRETNGRSLEENEEDASTSDHFFLRGFCFNVA